MAHLKDYNPDLPVVIDIETISFSDTTPGFDFFNTPTRISGVAITQNFDDARYFPIRHRTDGDKCLPAEEFLAELREFVFKCKHIINQNIKFDLHGLAKDGVLIDINNTRVTDTQVLGRYFSADEFSYSLDAMGKRYCKNFTKSDEVKDWVKKHKTEDYGRVPIEMMERYAILDVKTTLELYNFFMARLDYLPPEVLEYEDKLTRILWQAEHSGVEINKEYLYRYKFISIANQLKYLKNIQSICGQDFNPGSSKQVQAFFEANGLFSDFVTKGGGKSYGHEFLETVAILDPIDKTGPSEVARNIIEYNSESTNEATFCSGWMNVADKNNRIHGQFRQSGTKTGRMSMGSPSLHNFPEWAKEALVIDPGKVGIKFDYSQIEYRVFAHYGGDESVIKAYEENPLLDYHQLMADRLGIPRKAAKTINFAIIYGIGKGKLARYLMAFILENDTIELRAKLERFNEHSLALSEFTVIPPNVLEQVAINIRQSFLDANPAIGRLNGDIRHALQRRGWIRNFYHRRYNISADRAYIGLNYLCQGTAADFVKRRGVDIFEDPRCQEYGVFPYDLDTTIHDSYFIQVPESQIHEVKNLIIEHAVKSPFKVPVAIDMDVCFANWKNSVSLGTYHTHPHQFIKEAS